MIVLWMMLKFAIVNHSPVFETNSPKCLICVISPYLGSHALLIIIRRRSHDQRVPSTLSFHYAQWTFLLKSFMNYVRRWIALVLTSKYVGIHRDPHTHTLKIKWCFTFYLSFLCKLVKLFSVLTVIKIKRKGKGYFGPQASLPKCIYSAA